MRIATMQLLSSGHWRVRIHGKCFYLGRDSSTAERKYRALIAEHYGPRSQYGAVCATSVSQLLNQYIADKLATSDPKWRTTREQALHQMKVSAIELYGTLPACDFGPKAYRSARKMMCNSKRSVSYVNGLTTMLKSAFKWGVSEELVPVETYQRLLTVPDLLPGEHGLKKGKDVQPVPEWIYKATLPFLTDPMADLLRLLWLSGARPDEILCLTPDQLVKDGEYYVYRPTSHKTVKKNKLRSIVFGAESLAILRKYWPGESATRFFPQYGSSGVIYTAIRRACQRAKLPLWHTYQLRHAAITRISLQHGKDVAQAVAGHAKATMTDHYDAGNLERAKRAAG